ncbi:hypothetical protein HPP92_016850 [Vanilla planifolia]|uniref:CID domain-containing protein n=1 Tax=Vanilla planifolia TaxID=51239 RepID=A0A835QM93_VANPL|nr:hypothetical protein HPP92_016850 [Vanilla planifolia]
MLVSDILHNSSVPVKNASAYRTKFETTLPDIMESFNDLYRSVTGRITAEALKERVLKVLQVWADWFLFSDAYVNGLRATFLRSGNSGVIPFHSICGDVPEIENKASADDISEGGKLNQDAALAMGRSAAMKELLGLPLAELERRCRHNGISLVGGREMMVARLLYLEEAEKQRSYERDDELRYGQSHFNRYPRDDDGWNANNAQSRDADLVTETSNSAKWNRHGQGTVLSKEEDFSTVSDPIRTASQSESRANLSKKGRADPILPASKWSRDDDDGSDGEDKKGSHGLGLGYSSSGSENVGPERADAEVATDADVFSHPDISMSEEYRQKLRRLEVAVMEYRESLEERGLRSSEDIERKVASYRRRLQSDYGLQDSSEGLNRQVSQKTSERKEKQDDGHDSSRKRHRSKSHSRSPTKKPSTREREEAERDRDRLREKDSVDDLQGNFEGKCSLLHCRRLPVSINHVVSEMIPCDFQAIILHEGMLEDWERCSCIGCCVPRLNWTHCRQEMDPDTPDGSHITRRTSRNVCKSLKVAPTPAGVPATPSKG